MPTTPAGQPTPAITIAGTGVAIAELLERLGHHAILDRAALGVRGLEDLRALGGGVCAGEQQRERGLGGTEATRRVDPRRELPRDGARIDLALAVDARRGEERGDAGARTRDWRRRRPSAVRMRFSAVSGTRSAIVPSATRSSRSRTSGSAQVRK